MGKQRPPERMRVVHQPPATMTPTPPSKPAAAAGKWKFVVNNVLVGRIEIEAPGETREEALAVVRGWLTDGITPRD